MKEPAIYRYQRFNFDGSLSQEQVNVLIVGETAKSYRICLIEGAYRHSPNQVIVVRKRSVSPRTARPVTPSMPILRPIPKGYRLPYAD